MNAKGWKWEKKWNSGHDPHRRRVREDQGEGKNKEFVVLLEEPGIALVEWKYPECKQKRETGIKKGIKCVWREGKMGKELLHHELWELLSPGEAAPSQIPEGRSHRQTPGVPGPAGKSLTIRISRGKGNCFSSTKISIFTFWLEQGGLQGRTGTCCTLNKC